MLRLSSAAAFCAVFMLLSSPEMAKAQSPAKPSAAEIEGRKLQRIGDRYFEDGLKLNPLMGSFTLSEERFEDKLEITISPAHQAKDKARQERVLRELKTIDPEKLSEADRQSLEFLRYQAQNRLEGHAFPGELMPVDHFGGLPVLLAQFATGQSVQPLKTAKNYDNFLKRLDKLPQWTDQAIANIRQGIKQGIVLPKPLIERGLETLKPLTETDVTKHPYYEPVKNFPDTVKPADRKRLEAAYRTAIEKRLQPSIAKLVKFIETEYVPKGRMTAGIGALPGGDKWYAYMVRVQTTTTMTPDAIHELGLKEVARIRGEMDKIRQHYKFEGTLTEFLKQHPLKPENRPFKTDEEVLEAYRKINKQIMAEVPKYFSRVPKAPLEIRAVPDVAKATASDHYNAPAPDGSRPGVFFTVIMDPKEYSTTGMVTLYLHEGAPGHHFHIALQQELPLPKYRKYDWITAYGEGWALYAETLGHEMGLYKDDPNAYLGHLSDELLRAVRLVTDTGLHAKGWTREQTIQYMMDTQGYSELESRRATERYMAWPGQALAYKIGALKIRELRDRAQAKLGPKFSYPAFHEQILSDGVLPLGVLEAKVDRWIAAQSK